MLRVCQETHPGIWSIYQREKLHRSTKKRNTVVGVHSCHGLEGVGPGLLRTMRFGLGATVVTPILKHLNVVVQLWPTAHNIHSRDCILSGPMVQDLGSGDGALVDVQHRKLLPCL